MACDNFDINRMDMLLSTMDNLDSDKLILSSMGSLDPNRLILLLLGSFNLDKLILLHWIDLGLNNVS